MTFLPALLPALLLQAEVSTDTRFLFQSERIFTVLTVVLIIWGGVMLLLLLTNRKISQLEKRIWDTKDKH